MIEAVRRPQPAPARFVLDVHLGTVARRLRLGAYARGAGPGQQFGDVLDRFRLLLDEMPSPAIACELHGRVTSNLRDHRPLHADAITPGGPGHFG